ncbi:MAG TPA: DUF4345 family protein [Candidatus Binatia bacterium]|nr:DUF4345 family protein [Candidatus Binatia bacterium]
MTLARVFLVFTALVWLPYGIVCLLWPEHLADIAGVAAHTTTGSVELRAMYGGVSLAVGTAALMGALRAASMQSALTTIATVCAGIGTARLLSTAAAGELSGYTAAALVLEWGSLTVASLLLGRSKAAASFQIQ